MVEGRGRREKRTLRPVRDFLGNRGEEFSLIVPDAAVNERAVGGRDIAPDFMGMPAVPGERAVEPDLVVEAGLGADRQAEVEREQDRDGALGIPREDCCPEGRIAAESFDGPQLRLH